MRQQKRGAYGAQDLNAPVSPQVTDLHLGSAVIGKVFKLGP